MEPGRSDLLCTLLGARRVEDIAAAARTATEGRAQVLALAVVLGAYEAAADKSSWRRPHPDPLLLVPRRQRL